MDSFEIMKYVMFESLFDNNLTIFDFARLALVSRNMMGWILWCFSLLEARHLDHLLATFPSKLSDRLQDKTIYPDVLPYPQKKSGGPSFAGFSTPNQYLVGTLIWFRGEEIFNSRTLPFKGIELVRYVRTEGTGAIRHRVVWPDQGRCATRQNITSSAYSLVVFPMFDPALDMALHRLAREKRKRPFSKCMENIGFHPPDGTADMDTEERSCKKARLD
jgi:hypothetical protein